MRKGFYGIPLALAAALGVLLLVRGHTEAKDPPATAARRVLYWIDPMHPAYKSDRPGIAPDCGMPLEPVYADEGGPSSPAAVERTAATVSIDSDARQMFGIRVVPVESTSGTRTRRVPGRVVADESRVYRIGAALDGFVKETYRDTVGSPVRKGQRLAVVYSQEYTSSLGGYVSAAEQAQFSRGEQIQVPRNDQPQAGEAAATPGSELPAQVSNRGRARNARESASGPGAAPTVRTWADRLRNLGVGEAQIEEMYTTRKVPDGVDIVAPADGYIVARNVSAGMRFERNAELYRIADLSRVWIVADLLGPEDQPRPGAVARVTAWNQSRSFSARVSASLPQVDPVTRAVKLRLEADNGTLTLRPDMLVSVDFELPAPGGLSVPADAVIDSGLSQRVYADLGNGTFVARQVETGERFADRVQILSGLSAGDKVVASGAFLVDSESRLKSPLPR
jgi:membrane fusion protein, copper/silver efflux system